LHVHLILVVFSFYFGIVFLSYILHFFRVFEFFVLLTQYKIVLLYTS
jgi:hypothetical protein